MWQGRFKSSGSGCQSLSRAIHLSCRAASPLPRNERRAHRVDGRRPSLAARILSATLRLQVETAARLIRSPIPFGPADLLARRRRIGRQFGLVCIAGVRMPDEQQETREHQEDAHAGDRGGQWCSQQ